MWDAIEIQKHPINKAKKTSSWIMQNKKRNNSNFGEKQEWETTRQQKHREKKRTS